MTGNNKSPYDMTDEEIGAYINTVLVGDAVVADDVGEMNIMGEFKVKMGELKQQESAIASAKAQVVSMEKGLEQTRGAINTLSTMLVRMEDARRQGAPDLPDGAKPAAVVKPNRAERRAAESKTKKTKTKKAKAQGATPVPDASPNGATGAQNPA